MSEWQEEQYVPFETYFEIPLRNGLTKPKRVRGEGYKMINMGEIFKYSRMKNIPMDRVPLNDKELDSSMIADGDLLFARQSLVRDGAGKCSIFLEDDEEVCFESHLIRCRLDKKKSDPLFFYYFFNSSIGKNTMDAIIEQGAGAAGIRGSDLSKLQVPNLSVNRQNIIAEFLDFIDQKIELNQRMNETLEGMARAIFKSWFVDFDPVHAKAEGRDPEGMDARTAALFPSAFTPDGLPEEWTLSEIGDEVTVCGGSTPSTKEPKFWDGDIHWTSPKDLSSLSHPVLLDTERKITEAGLKKITSGLLPKGTVLMSSRAPIGYLAIAEVPVAINQGYIAMIADKKISNVFVWLWTLEKMDEIKSFANGSTFQEISKKNFRPISVCVPDEKVLQAFDELVIPLYQKIVSNVKENQTLATLRDTLLPKLISGELRIDTTQTDLKEAV